MGVFSKPVMGAGADSLSRDSLLYWNAGFSFSHDDRIGCQLGISYSQKRVHTFRAMYLFSKEVSIMEKIQLDRVVKTNTLMVSYGFVMDLNRFRMMPTAGVSLGISKFRTNAVDTIVNQSGWYSVNTYKYNYNTICDAGLTFSIAYMYAGESVGVSAEPYVTFKRNVEAGITFNLLLGRLD